MKKLLSTMTLLGVLSGAAVAAPYYTAVPAGGDLTPADVQPVYSIDAIYTIGDGDAELDMWGLRGSFNLYNSGMGNFRHQFNLNISPQWGDESGYCYEHNKCTVDVFMLPITAGYDLNIELTEDVLFYVGAKAGYNWVQVDSRHGDDSDGGFIWSVGAGLKFQCSDAVYIRAGYEFSRSYFKDINVIYGAHSIILGVGVTF